MSNFRRTYHHFVVKPIKRLILLPRMIARYKQSASENFWKSFFLETTLESEKEENRRKIESLLQHHQKIAEAYQNTISQKNEELRKLEDYVNQISLIASRTLSMGRSLEDNLENLEKCGAEKLVTNALKALHSQNGELFEQIEMLQQNRISDLLENLVKYSKDFRRTPLAVLNEKGETIYESPAFARKAREDSDRIKEDVFKSRKTLEYPKFRAEYSQQEMIEGKPQFIAILLHPYEERKYGKTLLKAIGKRYSSVLNTLKKIHVKKQKPSL